MTSWFSRAAAPAPAADAVEPEEDTKVLRDVAADVEPDTGSAPDAKQLVEKYEEAEWLEDAYEGQLSVDVFETEKDIVIISAIAGVAAKDIDISINNDMVTIKGSRQRSQSITTDNYLLQECHWGGFSRSIILPVDVIPEKIAATLTNGILEVHLPKSGRKRARNIPIQTPGNQLQNHGEEESESAAGSPADER